MKKIRILLIIFTFLYLPGKSHGQIYYYDSLNFLQKSKTTTGQIVQYKYDALGNRTAIVIPCQPPINLAAENITGESATISWRKVGSFNTWNMLWGESGFNPVSQGNLIEDISESQLLLTNLDPETTYDVYVNSNCDASEQSEWRGPCSFATPGAVLAIYDVTGGGSYCETDWPNGEAYLTGSQAEAVYQLYKDGVAEGQVKNGTGGALSWFDLPQGIYTVEGIRNQLSGWMSGSITVSEIGIPAVFAGADATIAPEESYLLSDASAENYSNIMWGSMGDGTFSDPDIINPAYNPGQYDIASGYVELSLFASPIAPCFVFAEDYISLSIMIPPPQQVINLNSGWSGISSYIAPAQTEVGTLLQPIISDLIILQGVNGFYWPGENINTLVDWNPYAGYKIKVNQNTTLSITGSNITNKTILLDEGWNLIPVLDRCYSYIEDLFSESGIIVAKEVSGTAVYWPAFSINTLQLLMPGKAYFVLMETESQVTYPDCGDEMLPEKAHNYYQDVSGLLPNDWISIHSTANTHIIAIPSDVSNFCEAGDIVGVFSELGNLCGATVIENPGNPYFITVYGDDPTTTEIDGFSEEQKFNLRIYRPSTKLDFPIYVEFVDTLPNAGYFEGNGLSAIASIEHTGISDIESNALQVDILPNPSSGVFNIKLNEAAPVNCEVYDIHGVCILKIKKGSENFAIDLSAFPKGIYYLKITEGGLQAIRKLVLQ